MHDLGLPFYLLASTGEATASMLHSLHLHASLRSIGLCTWHACAHCSNRHSMHFRSSSRGQYPLLQVQKSPLLPLPQRTGVHSTQLGSTKLARAVRAAAANPHTVGQIAEKAGSLPSSNDLANLKVFFTAAPQLLAGNPAAVSSVSLVVDRTLLQPLVRLLILRLRRQKTSLILPGQPAHGQAWPDHHAVQPLLAPAQHAALAVCVSLL